MLCSVLFTDVATLNVAISPEHVTVDFEPRNITFTCTADTALTGCQFSWFNGRHNAAGPLLELSRGPQSQADPAHLNTELTGYSYTGRGLEAGDCGVSLELFGYNWWIVACRVRSETGGWKYSWAELIATCEYNTVFTQAVLHGDCYQPQSVSFSSIRTMCT